MCKTSRDCACQSAAVNTYLQLRARGVSGVSAFDTASRALWFHNPDMSLNDSRLRLAQWLDAAEDDSAGTQWSYR